MVALANGQSELMAIVSSQVAPWPVRGGWRAGGRAVGSGGDDGDGDGDGGGGGGGGASRASSGVLWWWWMDRSKEIEWRM